MLPNSHDGRMPYLMIVTCLAFHWYLSSHLSLSLSLSHSMMWVFFPPCSCPAVNLNHNHTFRLQLIMDSFSGNFPVCMRNEMKNTNRIEWESVANSTALQHFLMLACMVLIAFDSHSLSIHFSFSRPVCIYSVLLCVLGHFYFECVRVCLFVCMVRCELSWLHRSTKCVFHHVRMRSPWWREWVHFI